MGKTMFLQFLLGLFLIAASTLSVAGDAVADAKQTVDLLNNTLIDVMKDAKKLGYQGRYKKLEPVVKQVFEVIQRINKAGTTVLLAEQNAYAALNIASRAYVIEQGEVVLEGEAATLQADPRVIASYLGGTPA